MKAKHIVVIGGGITGLTAAYELHKRFASIGQAIQITLLEKSNKLGGAIQTLKRDGFVIEKGPDSFLARKPVVLNLSKELGLVNDLTGLSPTASKSSIYMNGKLHPMPAGLAMGIPTQIKPFVGTSLLSLSGKARASLDFLLPRKDKPGDESLGSLIERRLGKEVADRLVGPILAGIYAGDLNLLSTAATFPQLLDMEEKHRSLILGMLSSRSKQQTKTPNSVGVELPPHLRSSMFLTYKGGLCTLVDHLNEELRRAGTLISLNSLVETISLQQEGYEIRLASGAQLTTDGIILSAPAEQASHVLQGASQRIFGALRQIPSVSVANVVMAFDQAQFKKPLQGSGFVVPRHEGLLITACTWTSVKWNHTAPKGKVLIRAYLGRWGDQTHLQLNDFELKQRVIKDLVRILGERVSPLFTEITRHTEAMSQYLVGHMERLRDIEEELHTLYPNLIIAGRSYRGVGIPDCIAQGKDAAERLFQQLHVESYTN
ncbi:protoporphyrinogen oxidase [Paenibacillus sp. SYP-B3998]|uniref:Coproporphyrinogen III oxidase n=1 Tax=Paenibacillus sp. SYP-B3998 TaxID=2678564 RepID=A0A6G3ZWC9_9BACL|nr:protoporphyrinogen oxidase [Paenibacillus sp. SYP-B3998]NEW05899.1 protoporphyrinogen oxidase [Paenibacillus sp. SYP-B3998]